MIVTLTPNPSLDLLFRADRLIWDDANRIAAPRRRAGGQGINLVRAARALDPGAPALAVAPLGGPVGDEMRALLAADGTPLRAVEVAGDTRVFVGVREAATGRALLLNPRGPRLTLAEGAALLDAVDAALAELVGAPPADPARRGWLVCCGSLPPGLPADFYARAGALARRHGFRFVADCDGEALAAAAPSCDLLAPNALTRAVATGTATLLSRDAHLVRQPDVDRIAPHVALETGATSAVLRVTKAASARRDSTSPGAQPVPGFRGEAP